MTDILPVLAEAKEKPIVVYHEFISQYSQYKKIIFGFVEGKDDPCFYKNFIDSRLPSDWKSNLIQAGNKKHVIEVYRRLKWSVYKRNQVLFFMDRDFSDYIDEEIPSAKNIYITDGYSIENSIFTEETFERGLRELLGFNEINDEDMKLLRKLFHAQKDAFYREMIPLMSQILFWRKNMVRINDLDAIKTKHFIQFEKGCVRFLSTPNKFSSFEEYLTAKCLPDPRKFGRKDHREKFFCSNLNWNKYIRGKYVISFMVELMCHIKDSWRELGISKQPTKASVNLCPDNAVAHLGSRTRVPDTLNSFFKKTVLRYIKAKKVVK